MPNVWEAQDIVLSIGNTQITGKDCICRQMDVSIDNDFALPELDGAALTPLREAMVTINLTLLCRADQFTQEFWETDYKPKIRHKKVEECSIQELLFAVREKAKKQNAPKN